MKEIFRILNEINPDVDYENNNSLIDDGILDSFDIVTLVGELSDAYEVSISAADITVENFNSAKAMYDMILRLK